MREIQLDVVDARFDDPLVLVDTPDQEWRATSTYTRTYPLMWEPLPDTLFMRATKLDMGVFGDYTEQGDPLQMIESRHTSPGLEDALRNEAGTIAALVKFSHQSVTPGEVLAALKGRWPDATMSHQRGAVLQAAAFAHALVEAIRFAVPTRCAVVWEYRRRR